MTDDPQEAEFSLSRRRAETAELIGELRSRATVGYLSRQAAGKALPALAGLGPAAGRTVARSPVGTALLTAGLGWMFFAPEPDLPGIARKAATRTRAAVSGTATTISETASTALEKAEDAAGWLANSGREIAGHVQDMGSTVSAAMRRTANAAPGVDRSIMLAAAFAGGIAMGLMLMRRGQ